MTNDLVQATFLLPKSVVRILERKARSAGATSPDSDINNLVMRYIWRGILNEIKGEDLSNRRVREGEEITIYDPPE